MKPVKVKYQTDKYTFIPKNFLNNGYIGIHLKVTFHNEDGDIKDINIETEPFKPYIEEVNEDEN